MNSAREVLEVGVSLETPRYIDEYDVSPSVGVANHLRISKIRISRAQRPSRKKKANTKMNIPSFPGSAPVQGNRGGYSLYDEVATAEVFSRGTYFTPGDHEVEVDTLKNSEKPGLAKFIIEAKVLTSTDPSTIGQIRSQVCKIFPVVDPKKPCYGLGEMKEFLCALYGATTQEEIAKLVSLGALSRDNIQSITGTDMGTDGKPTGNQPCRGKKLRVSVSEKPTKGGPNVTNPRGVVTIYRWSPLPG